MPDKVVTEVSSHGMPPPDHFVIADLTSESDIRKFLQSMTKPKMKSFLSETFGYSVKYWDKTLKNDLIEHIVHKWPELTQESEQEQQEQEQEQQPEQEQQQESEQSSNESEENPKP